MGESELSSTEIETLKQSTDAWLEGLPAVERTLADAVLYTHSCIVERTGLNDGCYHLAMFLNRYLREIYKIETKIIVGWIEFPRWKGALPHAWIEYGRKKTDISLTHVPNNGVQPVGALLVLDHIVKPGWENYSYSRKLKSRPAAFLEQFGQADEIYRQLIEVKRRKHEEFAALASAPGGVNRFLDEAPPGKRYKDWVRLLGVHAVAHAQLH